MTARVKVGSLDVAEELHRFVTEEALPDRAFPPRQFWSGYEAILRDLAPRNKALLDRRDELQREIDGYHAARKGAAV